MRKPNTGWMPRQRRGADTIHAANWLTDRGSLTARLQKQGRFSVRLGKQGRALPTADEKGEIFSHKQRRQLSWIREVTLLCDDAPLVFAHTALACAPRGPLHRWLARLGQRSLGALLFAHPGFRRGILASKRLDYRHPLFHAAVDALQLHDHPPRHLWARRSSFSFANQSVYRVHQHVLVTEIFSPHISNFTNPCCEKTAEGGGSFLKKKHFL